MVIDQYHQDPYCRDAVRTLAARLAQYRLDAMITGRT